MVHPSHPSTDEAGLIACASVPVRARPRSRVADPERVLARVGAVLVLVFIGYVPGLVLLAVAPRPWRGPCVLAGLTVGLALACWPAARRRIARKA